VITRTTARRILLAASLVGIALAIRSLRPPHVVDGVSRVQASASSATISTVAWVRTVWTAAVHTRKILDERAALERLRVERIAATATDAEFDALQELRETYDRLRDLGVPVTARVIAADLTDRRQSIRVRLESERVIPVGAPVLADGALLGTVVAASRTSATVELLTDARARIGVALATSPDTLGILGASPSGGVIVTQIPSDASVHPGDAIVTAPLADAVPAGIPIGSVVAIRNDADGFFRTAAIDPIAHAGRSRFVAILVPEGG